MFKVNLLNSKLIKNLIYRALINSEFVFFIQVKIQPVAKYDWEHKYYYGRLIAVSNSFLAYAIRGESPGVPAVPTIK